MAAPESLAQLQASDALDMNEDILSEVMVMLSDMAPVRQHAHVAASS